MVLSVVSGQGKRVRSTPRSQSPLERLFRALSGVTRTPSTEDGNTKWQNLLKHGLVVFCRSTKNDPITQLFRLTQEKWKENIPPNGLVLFIAKNWKQPKCQQVNGMWYVGRRDPPSGPFSKRKWSAASYVKDARCAEVPSVWLHVCEGAPPSWD